MLARFAGLALALSFLGACTPEGPGWRGADPPAGPPGFTRTRIEARLGLHEPRQIRFEIDVPQGWTAGGGGPTTRFVAPQGRGVLEVGLSCEGPCGSAQTLGQNLRRARTSDLPKEALAAMGAPPTEEAPGRFRTRWQTSEANGDVHHVAVDRLLEGADAILVCTAEAGAGSDVPIDALERACRSIVLIRS